MQVFRRLMASSYTQKLKKKLWTYLNASPNIILLTLWWAHLLTEFSHLTIEFFPEKSASHEHKLLGQSEGPSNVREPP